RGFQKGKSFILQFKEITSEDLEQKIVFIDKDGHTTTDFVQKKDTSEITIDCCFLPQKTKEDVSTAVMVSDSKDTLFLAYYDHTLSPTDNKTTDNETFNIIYVFNTDYLDWLTFRINAQI